MDEIGISLFKICTSFVKIVTPTYFNLHNLTRTVKYYAVKVCNFQDCFDLNDKRRMFKHKNNICIRNNY